MRLLTRGANAVSVAALTILVGVSAGSAAAEPQIAAAPAFKARDLVTPPRANWITNGGNTFNQRYSPLTELNRDTVKDLKALWRTSMGSGANPNNSGQAQILHYDGTLYVINGANDVFAIDVDTGAIRWTYHGKPDPKAGVGKSSRGVALGDGKVFVGQLDAKLVALDQKTGAVVWAIEAEQWQKGFSITSAPLYYDGMVITGFSGGETASRGRVKAFRAKDGKALWQFNTVPGPGEFGHDTWPQDSNAWELGGAPVWQTPAVDPELDLVYFSTGNPGPDLHGGVRPGDNLFSVSIVAVEAHTGKYRWHFQQVHHDIWDYDSPNPVVLFDAPVNGVVRKALVEVSKTGWAYILDRATGTPLLGIEERPVMQESRQATAATQPYPIGDAIVPQSIDIPPEGSSIVPSGASVVNDGRIFTPFWTDPITMKPGTMGGANWPPSSYDPDTHLLYVCATDRINSFSVQAELPSKVAPNDVYMGGRFVQAAAGDRGIFAALDVTTNKLAWRQGWREICYSGSVVTAGGLLFVGRNDGRLTALDKSNGRSLWEFRTDAGVNTTVTTFDWHGDQRVVVHAGGGVFAGAPRGDGIWMFSLKGTMKSLPAAVTTTGGGGGPGGPGGTPRAQAPAAPRPISTDRGRQLYGEACVACHGEQGDGGHGGGPTLIAGLPADTIVAVAGAGRNNMPPFGRVYSDPDLRDIAAYITTILAK